MSIGYSSSSPQSVVGAIVVVLAIHTLLLIRPAECSNKHEPGAAATYPVFPPFARATLVGHCYGFDAFNCPGMYIGRSFTSLAYFDYSSGRLREDDLLSVDGPVGDVGVNFERVYGKNLNSTHVVITLFYMLSNESVTPFHCVRAIYPGQMNLQTFMENATLVRSNTVVHGNVTCDQWLVNVPPAYLNVYFFVSILLPPPSSSKRETTTAQYSQVHRIEAVDGSFYVDYFQYESLITLTPELMDPPPVDDQACPVTH